MTQQPDMGAPPNSLGQHRIDAPRSWVNPAKIQLKGRMVHALPRTGDTLIAWLDTSVPD